MVCRTTKQNYLLAVMAMAAFYELINTNSKLGLEVGLSLAKKAESTT